MYQILEKAKWKRRSHNKGFTLVEVIVVLVIFALLAAILVPALLGYIDRSRAANCELNKSYLVKAAKALYVEAYGKNHKITSDSEFDEYLNPRIEALCENAKVTAKTLEYSGICNQGGIVTIHVISYSDRPLTITASCSVHDEEVSGNTPPASKTPEQIQKEVLTGLWGSGLLYDTGDKSSNGFTLGKAIASNKVNDTKELISQLGIDIDNNIVSIKNTTDIKSNDTYPISVALSNELGKNVAPSYTKIINISADNQGATVKKGDERIVTQYLFYEGKNEKNKSAEFLYGTRTVKLTYIQDGNLGRYTVTDLDGNVIDDTQGLVGWEKVGS